MKVALIYNKDLSAVINPYGMQNKEIYRLETVKHVADALETGGHNVAIIDGNMHVIENLQEFMPRVLEDERMGMVFNMAYGIQGESRYTHIPALLEMLGIPYVGSTPAGHAMALDKITTKILMQKHGLPTPEFWVFSSQNDDMSQVIFPAIVKPRMEAVSFGLSVVYNRTDLKTAVGFIIGEYRQEALVEQFIPGREFAVGLLGNNPPESFPVLEIDLGDDPNAIQTMDDKQQNPRRKICPAVIDPTPAGRMISLSKAAFKALGLRDFARVDIRLSQNNEIYILEINSMASLGSTGSYVQAARAAGYSYDSLVNKMLDVAAVRYFSNKSLIVRDSPDAPGMSISTRMRSFLRSREENLQKVLKTLVNINCHVRNVQNINDLGSMITRLLKPLGFHQTVYTQVDAGNILFFSNSKDTEGPFDVLFIGQLDSDIAVSAHEPFHLTENRYYGSGIWQHKGGLVVMLGALQALRFVRCLRKLKVGIILNSDSTLYSRYSRTIIEKYGRKAGHVIGLRGGALKGTVVTSRSGAALYHCSFNMTKTDQADRVSHGMAAFSRLISRWCELSDPVAGIIVAPASAELKSNIMDGYGHGEVQLSVRFNDPAQMESTDRKIKHTAKHILRNGLSAHIEGGMRRPPFISDAAVEDFYHTLKKQADQLDIRLIAEHRWSSSEICFIDKNIKRIDALGPVGSNPRGAEEFILRHSMFERAVLLASILYEISKQKA